VVSPIFLTSVVSVSHIFLENKSVRSVIFIPETITLHFLDNPFGTLAMGFSFSDFRERYRAEVIREWVERLKTQVGEQYSRRPRKELYGTVTGAFEANFHLLLHDDYGPIDRFIDKITRLRLGSGFLLSDVQKAFELFRTISIPLLAQHCTPDEFVGHVVNLNRCLAYTTHRFSDHFQRMHEEKIIEHNRRLEDEVKVRTAELRESQRKYRTLVEEITDGYFVVQKEVIVFANQAFCQMHGYQLDEVISKKFSFFVAQEDRSKVLSIYKKSLKKKTIPRSFEYLRLTKDGRTFSTEILAKTTRYENRLSTIGICRDITQRKQMEQRVRESERMAYIGQITTSLSHEIRNPLSAVKMNLQLLKNHPKLLGNDRRRIDISVREVMRLERILTQLLDFAKPLHMELGLVDVNHLVISCGELLEMKIKEEKIEIVADLDPALPRLRADGERLSQAMINMMLNAIEASPVESQLRLRTRLLQNGGIPQALITVEDEGGGISENDRKEIFRPFFTTKSKGTGLGLANIKRIVEAHGGRVEVSNLPSRGAAFTIILPAG
jgi:PAS domain S-box-containing protein